MREFRPGSGVEVCFFENWEYESPVCRHGPMLLFEKYASGKMDGKRFFACSACRSRKECSAFMFEGDFQKAHCRDGQVIFIGEPEPTGDIKLTHQELLAMSTAERIFCYDCQLAMSKKALENAKHPCHEHSLKKGISNDELLKPSSELLHALTKDKTNAQYFLSNKSLKFLLKTLKKLKFTHVICVGMPTLHEEIRHAYKKEKCDCSENKADLSPKQDMDSLLLDIDTRYDQFTEPTRYCRFNMFNHHFFGDHLSRFQNFVTQAGMKNSKLCIVLDPPFGGLVDAIAETLKWLSRHSQRTLSKEKIILPTFWIFPYFMEKRIVDCHLQLKMLDYEVDYENHRKFKKRATSQRISPVRIFTNVCQSLIILPKNEGYRFCVECDRYVSGANKHCKICDVCPSKDGRTYVHCEKCNSCVKPGRLHCDVCGRCEVEGHSCRHSSNSLPGCHVCGQLNHKRRDCPLRKAAKHKPESPPELPMPADAPKTQAKAGCNGTSPVELSNGSLKYTAAFKNVGPRKSRNAFLVFHRRSSHLKKK